jgi:hypothetical protein
MFWPNALSVLNPLFIISSTCNLASGGFRLPAFNSTAWPSANRAYFVPFRLPYEVTVQHAWVLNGATVSGNVDIGIYSVDGTRIASTGSTAQAGTSAVQSISLSATLGPGLFYMALAVSNTTATVYKASVPGASMQMMGCAMQNSALPLPATATLISVTSAGGNYLPEFGICMRSFT